MGRIISGNVQRGIGVDTAILTNQTATNPEAGVQEVWDSSIAGAPSNGDVVNLIMNGIAYGYAYSPGDTAALMAAGVTDAAMLGSYGARYYVVAGVLDAGDEITLSIGVNDYVYTVLPADTPALVYAGLVALAIADPAYSVVSGGTLLYLTALARGVEPVVTCTWTVDPGLDATCVETILVQGTVAQAAWTCVDAGAAVTCTSVAVGTPAFVPTSSVVLGAGTTTFAALTLDTAGEAAWGTTAGAPTGSMRSSTVTAIYTVSVLPVTIAFWGYFGATLGWVNLVAPAAKVAGSYAEVFDAGSAQRVVALCTAFGAGASVDMTIQG